MEYRDRNPPFLRMKASGWRSEPGRSDLASLKGKAKEEFLDHCDKLKEHFISLFN